MKWWRWLVSMACVCGMEGCGTGHWSLGVSTQAADWYYAPTSRTWHRVVMHEDMPSMPKGEWCVVPDQPRGRSMVKYDHEVYWKSAKWRQVEVDMHDGRGYRYQWRPQ